MTCFLTQKLAHLANTPKLAYFLHDESGQDLIEYALIAALVGLGAITAVRGLGTKIGLAFDSIATSVTSNT